MVKNLLKYILNNGNMEIGDFCEKGFYFNFGSYTYFSITICKSQFRLF